MLPPKKHLYYTNGLLLIIAAMLVCTAWNIGNRSWVQFGFSKPHFNITVWVSISVIVIVYIADIIMTFVKKDTSKDAFNDLAYVIPVQWNEFKPYIFLALSAGICEEIIYRGFLIHYLIYLGGENASSQVFALLIPAIVFGISHRYQGWWAVIKIFLIAIILGIIYVSSASLLIVILIHVLIDLISGWVGIIYFKTNTISEDEKHSYSDEIINKT